MCILSIDNFDSLTYLDERKIVPTSDWGQAIKTTVITDFCYNTASKKRNETKKKFLVKKFLYEKIWQKNHYIKITIYLFF